MGESDTGICTAEQNIAKLDEVLNEYSSFHGLNIRLNSNIEKYLNLSFDELRNMTYEDCAAMSTIVAGYCIYLQKEKNRQKAKVEWSESIIEMTAASKINQYKQDFQTFAERRMLVIIDNSYMKKMNELKIKASGRLNEIDNIAHQVSLYVQTLKDLVLSKRKYNAA